MKGTKGATGGKERPDRSFARHLLVLRMSAMGDVAMLPHALRALKTAYPALRITVATQALFRPFFDGLEVGFLDVDTRGVHHSAVGMWRLAAEARRLGVDAVADVHDVLRSQVFRVAMRLHGIRTAHILKDRAGKRRFIRCGGRDMEPLRHTVLRYCDVFRRLGFRFDDPSPVTPIPGLSASAAGGPAESVSYDPAAADSFPAVPAPSSCAAAPHADPFGGKRGVWVGVAPFSAHRGKTYPEAQCRELVGLLSAACERVFIHSGGGAEAAFAQEMETAYPNVTALWGRVRLDGEIALIRRLDCVVTMDSLAMHLAALTGTKTVSIWGATHPGLGFAGFGSDPRGIVQADLACRPCSVYGAKACRLGDYRCLTAVTPAQVAERVAALIGDRDATGRPSTAPESPGSGV